MVGRVIGRADRRLARGEEPGCLIDPATDATGRLVLRRQHFFFTGRGDEVRQQWRTWEMEPVARPTLSPRQAEDLRAVAGSRHWPGGDYSKPQVAGAVLQVNTIGTREEQRVDCSGFYSLPPAAWRRLVDKGWLWFPSGRVTVQEPVRVTVAGRVALALREHQTRTSAPVGYIKPADHPNREIARSGLIGPWRKGGRVYDGTSFVVCSAGCFQGRCLDSRNLAQAEARGHRAEVVLLALGASQEQAKRAGARARAGSSAAYA